MAEKSPNAFRTISEVSEVLDVPAHVLRFWESRFNQIKPIKRGGGRRYYRPTDVELIRGIRTLLYTDGLTIKGAQKVLREKGVRHVMELGSDAAITDIAKDKPAKPDVEPDVETAEDAAHDAESTQDDLSGQAIETAPVSVDAEPGFGASFAYEATEIGFLEESAPEETVPEETAPEEAEMPMDDTPTPVDPDADLSDPTPEDPVQGSGDTATDLRDIIGKLERLRDSMRS